MLVPFKTRSILMSRNKNLWILIGSVIFMAALISSFVLMQPSAQDILGNSLENTQTIHAKQESRPITANQRLQLLRDRLAKELLLRELKCVCKAPTDFRRRRP